MKKTTSISIYFAKSEWDVIKNVSKRTQLSSQRHLKISVKR